MTTVHASSNIFHISERNEFDVIKRRIEQDIIVPRIQPCSIMYFPCQISLMDPSHREIAVRSDGAFLFR